MSIVLIYQDLNETWKNQVCIVYADKTKNSLLIRDDGVVNLGTNPPSTHICWVEQEPTQVKVIYDCK